MNLAILKDACNSLGWTFELKNESSKQVLYVYDTKQNVDLKGEFALKVVDNRVSYNNFYMKNGKELVKGLEFTFYGLNVEYAKRTVLQEFQAVGFKYMPDIRFIPTDKEKIRFKMIGHSKLAQETEKRVEIEFTILMDGTIVSDSNYIPEDIHLLADKAMSGIDAAFGTKRKEGEQIRRKEIPAKYKNKAYCSPSNKIIAKH